MRRTIAALRPVWDALLLVLLVWIGLDVVTALWPGAPDLSPFDGLIGLGLVMGGLVLLSVLTAVAPRPPDREPVELAAPVRGRWVAMNSPGQGLPSHGTRTRGQYSAVDLTHPSGPAAPRLVRWAWRGSRPEEFSCFGEPVHSMAAGRVVRVRDGQRDHRARNTWPGLAWLVAFEGLFREAAGTGRVLGNHVVVDHGDGTFAAYAHLQRGSAVVAPGDAVETGQVLARVGNTGNTSMPHLHVQLMDAASVDAAAGIPMQWVGLERFGPDGSEQIDDQLAAFAREPDPSALGAMPRNGEIFVAKPTDG